MLGINNSELLISFWLLLFIFTSQTDGAPKSKKDQHSKLPSFVKLCHRSDPELNACARSSLNDLKPRFLHGIPELYIPPIDPLIIPEVKMDQNSGAVFLRSSYSNIYVRGLSNFTLNELKVDPEKLKMSIGMSIPRMLLSAEYKIDGKIMLMPLVGEGPCQVNFTDVDITMELYGQKIKKNGRWFIKMRDIKMKYNLGNAKLNFENLFNGDVALSNRVNKFLNENWESLSEETRPLLENAMSEIVRASTDKFFNKYSFDDLLPE